MGDKELSIEDIKKLASLPTMEVIRATILNLITSSMSNILSVVNEPSTKILRLLNSKPEK
jgi:ribosomal protein L10